MKNEDVDKVEREVRMSDIVELPVEKGQILGNVVYSLNGKVIAENPVVSTQSLQVDKVEVKKGIFQRIADFFSNLFRL